MKVDWIWIAVAVIAVCIAWYNVEDNKTNAEIAKAAIEKGYIQRCDDTTDYKILWVKPEGK